MGRGSSILVLVIIAVVAAQVLRRRSSHQKSPIARMGDRLSEPIESLLDETEQALKEIRHRIAK